MGSDDGCTTRQVYLIPLNCTLKIVSVVKFYVVCILAQFFLGPPSWKERTKKGQRLSSQIMGEKASSVLQQCRPLCFGFFLRQEASGL